MKKKAYIMDLAFFGVFALAFVIVILVGSLFIQSYNNKYQQLNTSATGLGQKMMQQATDRFSNLFDWIFLTVFVLFAIGMFISMYFIDSHPAFFFIVIIVFAFILMAVGILQNVLEGVISNPTLGAEAARFPMITYVVDNWLTFFMVIGFVGIGLLFAKMRTGWFQ